MMRALSEKLRDYARFSSSALIFRSIAYKENTKKSSFTNLLRHSQGFKLCFTPKLKLRLTSSMSKAVSLSDNGRVVGHRPIHSSPCCRTASIIVLHMRCTKLYHMCMAHIGHASDINKKINVRA